MPTVFSDSLMQIMDEIENLAPAPVTLGINHRISTFLADKKQLQPGKRADKPSSRAATRSSGNNTRAPADNARSLDRDLELIIQTALLKTVSIAFCYGTVSCFELNSCNT